MTAARSKRSERTKSIRHSLTIRNYDQALNNQSAEEATMNSIIDLTSLFLNRII